MKKKHLRQRKLRKCKRKIKTKAKDPKGFRHNFGVNELTPLWDPSNFYKD